MLRALLIYLSKAGWAYRAITGWGLAWKAASRFVAGEKIEDALRVVRALNAQGINATLDHLGEHTGTADEARRAADDILGILDEIQKSGLRANVSIKLTQIGMGTDDEVCRANLQRILQRAARYENFVRIDIEESAYTDKTIRFYNEALAGGSAMGTVGMAAQSYLYRAEADVRKLLETGTRLRLVKGAYQESSEVAFPKKKDVDANYDTLVTILLDASRAHASAGSADGRIPPIPAIATHDEKRIAFAKSYAESSGLSKTGLEFQMLYGIRRDLQAALAREGFPVRVYVPFGTHWYAYFMRRLAERPANIWFFTSNFFKK